MTHKQHNTGRYEWYTPLQYINLVTNVMSWIDLDPASSSLANSIVQANHFYTQTENGLSKDWFGKLWLNPPYQRGVIELFVNKFIQYQYDEGIMLCNNSTETIWGQKLLSFSDRICFPRQRIKFIYGLDMLLKQSPTQGQMFIYKGENSDRFQEVFSEIGVVLKLS